MAPLCRHCAHCLCPPLPFHSLQSGSVTPTHSWSSFSFKVALSFFFMPRLFLTGFRIHHCECCSVGQEDSQVKGPIWHISTSWNVWGPRSQPSQGLTFPGCHSNKPGLWRKVLAVPISLSVLMICVSRGNTLRCTCPVNSTSSLHSVSHGPLS